MDQPLMTMPIPPILYGGERVVVYRILDRYGELLYVGMTANLLRRLGDHCKEHADTWWPDAAEVQFAWYESRAEASLVEQRAIRDERPAYNPYNGYDETEPGCEIEARPPRPLLPVWRYCPTWAEKEALREAWERGEYVPLLAPGGSLRAYAWLARAEGVPVKKIAADIGHPVGTVYAWLSGRR